MGRFYQTATPNKIDFMYKLPENQMMQALGAVEGRAEKQEAAIYDLYGKLDFNAHSKDAARKKEILQEYETQIDDLARKFQDDPMAFNNTKNLTKKLAQDLHKDWTRGEVASIQGNFNTKQEFTKRYKEAVTKGDVNAADYEKALAYFESNFQGTNYDKDAGVGANYNVEELAKYVNMEDLAEKRGAGYISDFVKNTNAWTDGKYIYKSEGSKEVIPKEHIYTGVLSAMGNDDELMKYYNQQIKFGALTQEQVNAKLQAAAARVAEKYDKEHRTSGLTSMTADSYGLQESKDALDRKSHAWKKSYDNKSHIGVDKNNETQEWRVVPGQSISEITKNIKDRVDGINGQVEAVKNELLTSLGNKNLSAENIASNKHAINEAIETARNTGDWSALKKLAYTIGGEGMLDSNGNVIGTTIDNIENNFKLETAATANNEQLINAMTYKAANDLKARDAEEIEKRIQTWVKQNPYLDEGHAAVMRDNLTKQYEVSRQKRATEQVDAILADPEFGVRTQSVYSTNGNFWETKVEPEHRAVLHDYLESVSSDIFDAASSSGHAVVQVFDPITKKMVTKPMGYNEMVEAGWVEANQFKELGPDEDIILKRKDKNGKDISYKKGKMRVVPEYIDGLGRNAYQVTLTVNSKKQIEGMGVPETIVIYVPEKDVPAPAAIKEIYKANEAKVLSQEMLKMADVKYGNAIKNNSIDPEQALYKSPYLNATYNPAKEEWIITSDSGVSRNYSKNAGANIYEQLLIASGKGGTYNPEVMNETVFSSKIKSESESKSSTTRK